MFNFVYKFSDLVEMLIQEKLYEFHLIIADIHLSWVENFFASKCVHSFSITKNHPVGWLVDQDLTVSPKFLGFRQLEHFYYTLSADSVPAFVEECNENIVDKAL